ncbi:unnamed protein product, partial [Rotaria sp. Silwood1]
LIIAANIVIVVVLHCASYNWRTSDDSNKRESDLSCCKKNLSTASLRQNYPDRSITTVAELVLATKQRTNAQVTRMLLAVTLSFIILYFPHITFYFANRIFGRSCFEISDHDIVVYKLGVYIDVIQNILSDLPHVVNFFLYCLAGKKFRSIFINEFHQLLVDFHLIKQRERCHT